MHDQIRENGSYKLLENETQINQRCSELDKLYDRIKRTGYHSQSELDKNKIKQLDTEKTLPPERKEITVHIGRDGEFLWAGGAHRLSIVKLLNIKSIPVRVCIRHTKWQEHRDAVYKNKEEIDKIDPHPDIQFE